MTRTILRLLVVLAPLALCSCRPIRQVPVRAETKIIEKLVPIRVDSATAVFVSKFDCDSTSGTPRMIIERDTTEGRINQTVTYDGGVLRVLSRVPP